MKVFFQTIGDAIMWFLIIVLVFFLASGLYQRFLSPDGYTGINGISYAVVVSGSMTPEILKGDAIVYQAQDPEEYQVGNIVVYIRDKGTSTERLIVHRIIELEDDMVITQGDANQIADQPFSRSLIVGRVVWRLPYVGTAVEWVRTPVGLAVIGGVLVVLIALRIVLNRWKKKKDIRVVGV